MIAARCGSVAQARDILLSAAPDSTDPADAIACYAEAISACFYLGDAHHAMVAAQRTEALLAHCDTENNAIGLVAAGMGRVLAGEGGADLIRAGIDRSRALPQPADNDSFELNSWLVLGSLFVRDSITGRDVIQQAVADRRAKSAVGALPHLLFHIARDEATTDRWANAEADYTEAIGLAREFGQTTELAASLAGLAWLEARQGRTNDATTHAAEAESLSKAHDVHLCRMWAQFALGDLALANGKVATAIQRYQHLERSLGALGILDVDLSPIPELVEALLRAGARTTAQDLAATYTRRAAAKGQPWALARAARARALLSPAEEVDAAFAAALDLHSSTLDAYEAARTRLAYGARIRRLRRRVDARPLLRQAFDTFTQLGARPWADAAADELAATGLSVPRPGDQLSRQQLTPRELQIAVLLAEGGTTRQVAAALFLSPKTVEYHLRHIYTKFDIDSRTELISRMSEG